MNSNPKSYESDEPTILPRCERTRDRRNILPDTSYQNHCYHQLAERVRELEKEIVPDLRVYQLSPVYSSFSGLTPCSNFNENDFSNYSRPQNFPMNLISPNSSVPTQRYGLSSKVLERAHQIPERFWIDWRQKQIQNRIEELEYRKNSFSSPNQGDLLTRNRRKSLLAFHDAQRRASLSRFNTLNRSVPISTNNEMSSSDIDNPNSTSIDQRSIENNKTLSPIQKSQPSLDRSRLTIFLPFSNTDIPKQSMSINSDHASVIKPMQEKTTNTKNNLIETMLCATSIEDVAQIDTEVNLTLLLRENQDQTDPLLYSKAVLNRTVKFRSLSAKNDSIINHNVERIPKQQKSVV